MRTARSAFQQQHEPRIAPVSINASDAAWLSSSRSRHYMRHILISIVAVSLFTACNKKVTPSAPTSNVSSVSKGVPVAAGFAAWGANKSDILAELVKTRVRIISDSGDIVIAEVGPAGLTDGDGKSVKTAVRLEYHFKDGKLAEMKSGL